MTHLQRIRPYTASSPLPRRGLVLLLVALLAGCGGGSTTREYELTGVIIGIDRERRQVLVRHDEIPGFMMAMTMPFPVRDASALEGRERGDVIRATLVVQESEGAISAYLTEITRTGHVELDEAPPASVAPEIVVPGEPVPDAAFVDQAGRPLTLADLRGHRIALTFMFTRCPFPEFCPLMDRHFVSVQRALATDPSLGDVRLVSVTLDPEYDSPEVLAAHARRLDADPTRWSFVTGEPAAMAAFSERLGIYMEREGPAPADMIHNLRTAVIGPDGRLAAVHSGNTWTPSDLLADLVSAAR